MVHNFEPSGDESLFVRWMQDWMQTGASLDVGRFRGVVPVQFEMMPNPTTLGYSLRIEFRADSIDGETTTETRHTQSMVGQYGVQTTGGIHPNAFAPYQGRNIRVADDAYIFGQKYVKVKKVEEHFDEDLFEL